jgi:hypothetical protein
MSYSIYDEVRVLENSNNHSFKKDQLVDICDIWYSGDGGIDYVCMDDIGHTDYLRENEFVLHRAYKIN